MVFQWLLPLGFLGLLSLAALILIYILRPKYQQRMVASTIPWKLALKKRKKKFPFDRFTNWLVFLCQTLILTACAMILAQPSMIAKDLVDAGTEKIIILDAGMNMRARFAEYDGKGENLSRFEKAINAIKAEIDQVLFEDNGTISLIIAEKTPRYLLEDAGRADYSQIVTALDGATCSYGVADLEAAVLEAQNKMGVNPQAKVEIFSGTDFGYMGDAVTVHDMSDAENEWNIAILSATPYYQENQYYFDVEVAAYGNVSRIATLNIDIKGVSDGVNIYDYLGLQIPVTFEVDANNLEKGNVQTLHIEATDTDIGGNSDWFVPSYREVEIKFLNIDDSIEEDNSVLVYGGEKDKIKVQYYSARRNIFFFLTFYAMQNEMMDIREITFDPVYDIDEEPESKGCDFYIYEHGVPLDTFIGGLPDDGVLIFCDPNSQLIESLPLGMKADGIVSVDSDTTLKRGVTHALTENVAAETITISQYLKLQPEAGSGYSPLLYCGDDAVLYAKKQGASQIVVMPFSVNQSNAGFGSLAAIFYNIVNYYMPLTLEEYAFQIDEKVKLNCKGARIDVTDPDGVKVDELKEFPAEYELTKIGVYTFTTLFSLNKENEIRKIYVRPPMSESSLFKVADLGLSLDNDDIYAESMQDKYLAFAIVIVALLFVEWWLQFKDIV